MQIIDLFCGCGGLSKGLEDAGHTTVAAFDSWALAVDTYNQNFTSHHAEMFDLSDPAPILKRLSALRYDAIVGGPPCQDFSSAGQRKEGQRANLTLSFAQIVSTAKPPFFVMENVARIKDSLAYSQARKLLKKAGYGLTEIVLDASRCGVPQIRKRFFCIGHLGGTDDALRAIIENQQSAARLTVKDYMGKELGLKHYYRHPRNYNRRAIYSVDEPAATIRGVNRPVPIGYKGHSNDSAPISKTLRALTTLERARLQTFPKGFKWLGSKTDIEQLIGNAVPVNLGVFVGQCLTLYQKSLRYTGQAA